MTTGNKQIPQYLHKFEKVPDLNKVVLPDILRFNMINVLCNLNDPFDKNNKLRQHRQLLLVYECIIPSIVKYETNVRVRKNICLRLK